MPAHVHPKPYIHLSPRFIIGVGAGIGLCVAPVFLAEISPPRLKSSLGVLTQLSVVIGIFITQLIGMHFANPLSWRLVFHCSSAIAVFQFGIGVFLVDSPAWLRSRGQNDLADSVASSLWGLDHAKRLEASDPETQAPLLSTPDDQESARPHPPTPPVSVLQLLSAPDCRRPLIILSLAMFSQQFSGLHPLPCPEFNCSLTFLSQVSMQVIRTFLLDLQTSSSSFSSALLQHQHFIKNPSRFGTTYLPCHNRCQCRNDVPSHFLNRGICLPLPSHSFLRHFSAYGSTSAIAMVLAWRCHLPPLCRRWLGHQYRHIVERCDSCLHHVSMRTSAPHSSSVTVSP